MHSTNETNMLSKFFVQLAAQNWMIKNGVTKYTMMGMNVRYGTVQYQYNRVEYSTVPVQ